MTVSYVNKVLNSNNFGFIWRLLFKWRGSVYKLVWPEFVLYMAIYYTLSLVYRFALIQNDTSKKIFENISMMCYGISQQIPLSFVLGFYVTLVVSRWWDMFRNIPWPDNICTYMVAAIHGNDARSRLIRHNVARYVHLAFILTLKKVSAPAQKRFPTLDHLIELGVLEEQEKQALLKYDSDNSYPKFSIPLVWASTLITKARKENLIRDDYTQRAIIQEILIVRRQLGMLICYNWINIPLVYTQVVTLVTYSYFMASCMGNQFVHNSADRPNDIDHYSPIFSILQFLFYMGLLKVAEVLLNPFGDDDDDFDINFFMDRHFQMSYLIVDELIYSEPDIVKDGYWECHDGTGEDSNIQTNQEALPESDQTTANENMKNLYPDLFEVKTSVGIDLCVGNEILKDEQL